MPELPEVEIVKQSLEKSVKYKRILTIIINNRNLRFKVDKFLQNVLYDKKFPNEVVYFLTENTDAHKNIEQIYIPGLPIKK